MCPGSFGKCPIMQRMLGFQSCGNPEFPLDYLLDRSRATQGQRTAKATVQQLEFLVLPIEVCLRGFHCGFESGSCTILTFAKGTGS
jgi:hypothetical protein